MRTIQLDHSQIVQAVQRAMVDQLRHDGRLRLGTELGVTFYASSSENVRVVGTVRHAGAIVTHLNGDRRQLAAIATRVALDQLAPGESRQYLPHTEVHWRLVTFRGEDSIVDRFFVDVTFQERQVATA